MPPRVPRLLFVCLENRHRSRTCEEAFRKKGGFEVTSAGTWDSALRRLRQEHLDWADLVFAMDDRVATDIRAQFQEWWRESGRKLEVLDIQDVFFTQEQLDGLKPICEAQVMDALRKRKMV